MTRRRAVTEAVTVMLLLVATIVLVGFVTYYFYSSQNRYDVGIVQQAVDQGQNAGQILHVVYYQTQNGNSEFYLYNSGNVAINVKQVYTVASGQATPENTWSICATGTSNTCGSVIQPGTVYILTVPGTYSEAAILSTTGNVLVLSAGGAPSP